MGILGRLPIPTLRVFEVFTISDIEETEEGLHIKFPKRGVPPSKGTRDIWRENMKRFLFGDANFERTDGKLVVESFYDEKDLEDGTWKK